MHADVGDCGPSNPQPTRTVYLCGLINFHRPRAELAVEPIPVMCHEMVEKGGKAGWNKGWVVVRMRLIDLGVKSAILKCDPRTRLKRGPVSPAYVYRFQCSPEL